MVSDRGMKCLWGRKISYLLFAEFLSILEWMAGSADTTIVKIDRWSPSNKTYRVGGTVNADLTLKPSSWTCEFCHTMMDRDTNAAINIKRMGLTKLGIPA